MNKDKTQEALKLALEALRDYRRSDDDRVSVAMGILQEALAEQPAQIDPSAGTQVSKVWWNGDKLMAEPIPLEKLYKEPEQPAQQQEPILVDWDTKTDKPIYTTLSSRKPLTYVEIERLYYKCAKYQEEPMEVSGWQEFARAIEAAHGIKGDA